LLVDLGNQKIQWHRPETKGLIAIFKTGIEQGKQPAFSTSNPVDRG
jgi:hypothetical protein